MGGASVLPVQVPIIPAGLDQGKSITEIVWQTSTKTWTQKNEKTEEEKEYLLQNVDKMSEERKNKAVSLALVTREDKDTLSGIDFIQKSSDIKQNSPAL